MRTFVEELKKRRVYRVALAYVVAGSALVQLAGTILPAFHAPEWAEQVFLVFVAIGFPVALMFAWGFDIEGGVIKKTRRRGRPPAKASHHVWILGALGFLIAGIGVGVYWSRHAWKTGQQSTVIAEPLDKSIAVLPFQDLSDDKQNAFFTEGIQHEILNNLAKVAELKVISRTSVMQYKSGVRPNLREIARTLGVGHVLEGSVQRSGDRVRVSAQLIDARTDTHIWGDHYDRQLADVFTLESEVAQQIASKLRAKLSPEEQTSIATPPTRDLVAYDFYMRAKAFGDAVIFDARASEHLPEAARLLEQAIARDPQFFLAHCLLSNVYDQLYFFGIDRTAARLALAETTVRTALRLRPDAGEAHLASAAHAYWGYRDYERARRELATAVNLLPNDSFAFELAGYVDRRQGRWTESIQQLQHALDVDPLNLTILHALAYGYERLRRFPEAAAILERAARVAPNDIGTRTQRAGIDLWWRADPAPLQTTLAAILRENPDTARAIASQRFQLALCRRDRNEAREALRSLSSEGFNENGFPYPRAFCEGVIAKLKGEQAAAQAAFKQARTEMDKVVRQQPDYAEAVSVLALIHAALDRKKEAIAEARRALELLSPEKDAISGEDVLENLVLVYAWTGDKDAALVQLGKAVKLPGLNYGYLRLHPYWDPLRGDPRFEKIVASLAPDAKR